MIYVFYVLYTDTLFLLSMLLWKVKEKYLLRAQVLIPSESG